MAAEICCLGVQNRWVTAQLSYVLLTVQTSLSIKSLHLTFSSRYIKQGLRDWPESAVSSLGHQNRLCPPFLTPIPCLDDHATDFSFKVLFSFKETRVCFLSSLCWLVKTPRGPLTGLAFLPAEDLALHKALVTLLACQAFCVKIQLLRLKPRPNAET